MKIDQTIFSHSVGGEYYQRHNAIWEQECLSLDLNFQKYVRWTFDFNDKPDIVNKDQILYYHDSSTSYCCIEQKEKVLVRVQLDTSGLYANIAGKTLEDIDIAISELKERYPHQEAGGENQDVLFNFWYHTSNGPRMETKKLLVPSFSEISNNYSVNVLKELKELVSAEQPNGGRLVLWSGLPGTGKTFALRALAWEWRQWVNCHYLIDPENFFGNHASNLMEILLRQDRDWEDSDLPNEGHQVNSSKYKLIILEDTGEMLSSDAKSRVGQGLSRLLNTVDGLIGQGMKIIILVTTNEEFKSLHPAVTRPGRCWKHIQFGNLTREESESWIKRNNSDKKISSDMSLADLYSLVNGWKEEEKESKIGFSIPRDV